ncbi:MAG: pantetheine-phosphate adenylyltransferase [Acidiferrobacteraceae bacterium]|jgi:pantetheine-phosphate adenylyltransferase|nr:pantetheine-phosphate adenylyltransferase [Acidiferrobacteraceae bacterium]MCP4828850.1 pantetheine-phosphate adenylyltransferase [Pseudomonadota bacterium]HJP06761.1 pantetheine-phosphate adenylyltransferase [Arenicellales bacterium]|tara:strand:+ start:2117 stop:2599 length:483 start_codon:yes stop_codon:yes gene_type:complete
MTTKAIYPGTFDPITRGHIDLAERAGVIFNEVVVAISASPAKEPLFSLEERLDMARLSLSHVDNITITGFDGLLIDCVHNAGAQVVLRGLRAVSDFEYEFQLAAMNRRLDPTIETMFLTPSERYTFLSASMVKEIAGHGGDVSQFLHPQINERLNKRLGH